MPGAVAARRLPLLATENTKGLRSLTQVGKTDAGRPFMN